MLNNLRFLVTWVLKQNWVTEKKKVLHQKLENKSSHKILVFRVTVFFAKR